MNHQPNEGGEKSKLKLETETKKLEKKKLSNLKKCHESTNHHARETVPRE